MVQYKFVLVFFVFSLKRVGDFLLSSFWSNLKKVLLNINGIGYSQINRYYIQTLKFPDRKKIATTYSGCLNTFSTQTYHKNKHFTPIHHIPNLDSAFHFSY